MASGHRYYRGHRASSFYAEDVNELIEIRARGRTFDGAYGRTAIGSLGFALTVLRLFDRRFFKIGVMYVILSVLLYILSYFRQRHSKHDFADDKTIKPAIQTKGVSVVVAAVEIGLFVLIFMV
ncbi:hypothetical protein ABKN59_004459 [Abortiporus biennis]